MGHEVRRTEELAAVLRAVFERLNSSGVDYCVLHNYEGLPDNAGRDIDILVSRPQIKSALTALRQTCRQLGWNLLAETTQMGNHSLHLFHDRSPRERFTIEVVAEITWGWMPTCDASLVLGTKMFYRGIPVAAPGAAAAARVLETVLHGQLPDEEDWINIRNSTRAQPDLFREVLGTYIEPHVVRKVLSAIDTADIEGLGRMVVRMRRSVLQLAAFQRPASAVREIFVFLVDRISGRRKSSGYMRRFAETQLRPSIHPAVSESSNLRAA